MSQPNDNSNDKAILFLAIIGVLGVAYYFTAPKFQEFFLTIKMWQMSVISILVPTEHNKALLHMLQNTPSQDWSMAQLRSISRNVNVYIAPFFFAAIAFAAIHIKKYLFLFEKSRGKNYTIDTLMQQEVNNVWRYLKPIISENLLENFSPDWAKAMKPQEFAIHNDLLNIPQDLMSLNEEKAKKVLALQLGPLYTGLDQVPPYIKALIGFFAEHLYGSSLKSQMAMMEVADSYGPLAKGKYNYSAGIKLLETYKDDPRLNEIMNSHAYIYTGLADLFDRAKQRGIIISKYFIWLKKTDRRLYYLLNAIGRRVSWVECAGIVDHYQHEKDLKRPLAKVFCNSAFAGLKEELKNVKITDRNRAMIMKNETAHRAINEQVYST